MDKKFQIIKDKMVEWLHFLFEGENKLWTIVFIIYFCFHKFFENLISDWFVEPFLSTFQDTIKSRIIALLIVSYILLKLYSNYKSKEKKYSATQIYLYTLILITCIYYRLINTSVWSYVGIFNNETISYFDIIPFTCLSIIIINVFPLRKHYKPNIKNSFYMDDPIVNQDEDILGRTVFAESLARKILDTQTSKGAFTIGIVAPWGHGKTSFLNLMKKQISGKAIVINFSPWTYEERKNLTQAFFLELNKILKVYNHSLSNKLIQYADLLSSAEVPYMRGISNLLKQNNKQSLESLKSDLENALKHIKDPIIVIIDDLDRLGATEIMEVMKIIRNSANFSNIRFIAAYDRDYVTNAIKNLTASENYLEKIFQIEYVLPNFDIQKLENHLFKKLSFVEEKDELELCFASYKAAFEELTNLRDIKRFVNMFQIEYRNLHGEIILADLMNLTILKLKYNTFYTFLAKNHDYILTNEKGNMILYNRDKDKNKKYTDILTHNKKIDIKSDWDSYFKDKYNVEQKNTILNILNKMFTSSCSKQINRINDPWSIKRYFHDTLLNEDYPQNKFNRLWTEDYNSIIEEINKDAPTKIKSFIKLMANYKPKNKDEYKKMVKSILYCGEIINKDFSQFEDVIKIINNTTEFEKKEYKDFILNALYEKSTLKFNIKILSYSSYTERGINGLSQDENQKIRLKIFKRALENDLSLENIYYFLLFTNRYNVEENGRFYKEMRHPEANEMFIEYAKKHSVEVISDFIEGQTINNKKVFWISSSAQEIWGTWDEYEKFLNNIKDFDAEKDEYLRFFNLFKTKTYNSVSFNFEHIKINKNNIH